MKRSTLRGLLAGNALFCLLLGTSTAFAGSSGFVFTADEAANTVSRIDLSTGQVETVPLPIVPHNVDIRGKGQPLLLVGPMAEHGMDGQEIAGMENRARPGSWPCWTRLTSPSLPVR